MKTIVSTNKHIQLVSGLIGNSPNSYDTQYFDTIEDAKKHWLKDYVNRNKKDGHDEYWNKKPFITVTVCSTTILQFHEADI